jgi:uncharacterized damage-inducible protein DinB
VDRPLPAAAAAAGRTESRVIEELLRYKAWANDLLYASLAKLPEDELTAPRPIVFGSILRTLNHVYAMDQVWQANLEGGAHGFTTRNPPASPPFHELRAAQKNIDAWYVDYAGSLKNDEEPVRFTFIGGGPATLSRRDILHHVVNHGTYHRGNVAAMMYQIGAVPPTTDLPVFQRA